MGCCLICDACSWGGGGILLVVCVFRRVECRCCVLGSVAILSAAFCVICSLFMFVSDVSGDHIVEAPNDSLHAVELSQRYGKPLCK